MYFDKPGKVNTDQTLERDRDRVGQSKMTGRGIIALGGSLRGAGTALVFEPVHPSPFFDLHIREMPCKPKTF